LFKLGQASFSIKKKIEDKEFVERHKTNTNTKQIQNTAKKSSQ